MSDDLTRDELAAFDGIGERWAELRSQLQRVIVGQDEAIDTLLTALLCQSHVLVVGVPGLAKTLLVRTLAAAVDLAFKRIQFTPDLMPSDIIGTELIQEDPATGERRLRFMPGPLFAQLLLADEINRTPPRTQAALLEAMAEHQVTAAGQTRPLDEPFVVVATQNPIEQEGTYPLPEAQLDRFLFSLWMDYPTKAAEKRIVAESPRIASESIQPVMSAEQLVRDASLVWRMPVSEHVVDVAVSLARATRPGDADASATVRQYVGWGAGPRAGQALVHAAKAAAAMAGEPTPSTAHVKAVAMHVLRHRVLLNYAAAGEGVDVKQIIDTVVAEADF
ncbi:AAA family ATPase [Phycisphaerales bacterium AB-hyl4]|uniref:AAA family ATPase n=1 Tax=Natronomicrosphaera hydrolytica TaxID=3242702 RepID=A0ABV4U9S1_9BACT